MPQSHTLDFTIRDLAGDLAPVSRLASPLKRAAFWLGAVVVFGFVLAVFADLGATMRRLSAAPDMSLAALGSTLTAVLGAVAVFELSLPDRKAAWAALPLPGAALWIGASGLGCLRVWTIPGTHAASMHEARDCLAFILGVSVPLSALMVVMVRRAFSLRPGLMAVMAGLTIAAAAATLLNIFHPYDASASDLAIHAVAVALVVGTHRLMSDRMIRAGSRRIREV